MTHPEPSPEDFRRGFVINTKKLRLRMTIGGDAIRPGELCKLEPMSSSLRRRSRCCRGAGVVLCLGDERSLAALSPLIGRTSSTRSHKLQHALTEAFERADTDPTTSVVLLRAEGRSFCAGS